MTVDEFLEKWCGEYSYKDAEKFRPIMKADLEGMLSLAKRQHFVSRGGFSIKSLGVDANIIKPL